MYQIRRHEFDSNFDFVDFSNTHSPAYKSALMSLAKCYGVKRGDIIYDKSSLSTFLFDGKHIVSLDVEQTDFVSLPTWIQYPMYDLIQDTNILFPQVDDLLVQWIHMPTVRKQLVDNLQFVFDGEVQWLQTHVETNTIDKIDKPRITIGFDLSPVEMHEQTLEEEEKDEKLAAMCIVDRFLRDTDLLGVAQPKHMYDSVWCNYEVTSTPNFACYVGYVRGEYKYLFASETSEVSEEEIIEELVEDEEEQSGDLLAELAEIQEFLEFEDVEDDETE